MVNIKNLTISQDGDLKKISVMWDVLDENGRIVGTNKRATRAATEESLIEAIETIKIYAENIIEEG